MVHVDRRVMMLSSKRSTHHAFLEGILRGKRYIYDNNVILRKDGTLDINRTTQTDEPATAPVVHVASFERQYELPGLYQTKAYRELESRHECPVPAQRIVYLRDPLNTLASTYSAHLNTDYFSHFGYVTANVRQWLNVANYVLDGLNGETFIYANQFWADEDYRSSTLAALDMSSYQVSDRLSTFGGGGNTFLQDRDQAITPEVLNNRFRTYAEDETYAGLVRENRDVFGAFCEHVGDSVLLGALSSL